MQAQVLYEARSMRLEAREIPELMPDEALVRVRARGICGSDIAYYWGLSPLGTPTGRGPLILGHEFSGDVAAMGELVERIGVLREGDRVTANPVQACGMCADCTRGRPNLCGFRREIGVSVDGAFAEFVKVRHTSLHKLPDSITYEEGALVEPAACGAYAVRNLNLVPGDVCVLFGPGPIGIMMLQMIKAEGAGSVIAVGTRDDRLNLAARLGADVVINTRDPQSGHYVARIKDEVHRITGGRLADRAICATSSLDAMHDALAVTGHKATIVYFGLAGSGDVLRVPVLENHHMDKTIRFSFLAPFTFPVAIELISRRIVNVGALVSDRFPLGDAACALQVLRERRPDVMKALVV